MANHNWLYLLNAEEMSNHRVHVKTEHIVMRKEDYPALMAGIKEDVVTTFRRSARRASAHSVNATPLLTWIRQDLQEAKRQASKTDATYLQEVIGGYLFSREPGMTRVGDFRHEWAFDEDLLLLSRNLRHIRRRLRIGRGHLRQKVAAIVRRMRPLGRNRLRRKRPPRPSAMDRQRKAYLAKLDSPLRVLDLRGWTFLAPEDIESLRDAFALVSPNALHHPDEWEHVFQAHQAQSYDLAAIIYTSSAAMI
jgi:hypothetical protein